MLTDTSQSNVVQSEVTDDFDFAIRVRETDDSADMAFGESVSRETSIFFQLVHWLSQRWPIRQSLPQW